MCSSGYQLQAKGKKAPSVILTVVLGTLRTAIWMSFWPAGAAVNPDCPIGRTSCETSQPVRDLSTKGVAVVRARVEMRPNKVSLKKGIVKRDEKNNQGRLKRGVRGWVWYTLCRGFYTVNSQTCWIASPELRRLGL